MTARARRADMPTIKLLLVTTLAILAAAMAARTLSSDPEWRYLSARGTDVAMEEPVLSYEVRVGAAQSGTLTGDVDVEFASDSFKLD
jgi:hypothetical protein